MWHEWEKRQTHARCYSETLRKKPFGRSRSVWRDNFKTDLKETR